MKLTLKICALFVSLALISIFSFAEIYEVNSMPPTGEGLVDQTLVTETWSYKNKEDDNGWHFCGQASLATAINYMRQTSSVSDATKISQLQWIHEMLSSLEPEFYANQYNDDPNKQASVKMLELVINNHKYDEFKALKVSYPDKEIIKQKMFDALDIDCYVIALSKVLLPNSNVWVGHHYVVHKIDYQPGVGAGSAHSNLLNGNNLFIL